MFNAFMNQALWESSDKNNVLKMYSKMADLQNTAPAFIYGKHEIVVVSDEIYSFLRYFDGTDR